MTVMDFVKIPSVLY